MLRFQVLADLSNVVDRRSKQPISAHNTASNWGNATREGAHRRYSAVDCWHYLADDRDASKTQLVPV
jgi:hypothetical protein